MKLYHFFFNLFSVLDTPNYCAIYINFFSIQNYIVKIIFIHFLFSIFFFVGINILNILKTFKCFNFKIALVKIFKFVIINWKIILATVSISISTFFLLMVINHTPLINHPGR